MSPFVRLIPLVAAIAGCSGSNEPHKASAPIPKPPALTEVERDAQVIEAALLHFLKDDGKDIWALAKGRECVLLERYSPEKTGMLSVDQINADDVKFPPALAENLRARNEKGDGFDAIVRDWSKSKFNSKIRVGEYGNDPWFNSKAWQTDKNKKVIAGAKGSFKCWAPGYSADGKEALLRAWFDPTPHSASATYLLKLVDGRWQVVARQFAYYA